MENNVDFISGPVTFYYFVAPKNISIFLFGDRHYGKNKECEKYFHIKCNSSECLTITSVLKKLFVYAYANDKYVDFYLEYPHKNELTEEKQNITIIYDKFFNCFLDRKCDQYRNVNFYAIDERVINHKSSLCIQEIFNQIYIDVLENFIRYFKKSVIDINTVEEIQNVLKYLKITDFIYKLFIIYIISSNYTNDTITLINKLPYAYLENFKKCNIENTLKNSIDVGLKNFSNLGYELFKLKQSNNYIYQDLLEFSNKQIRFNTDNLNKKISDLINIITNVLDVVKNKTEYNLGNIIAIVDKDYKGSMTIIKDLYLPLFDTYMLSRIFNRIKESPDYIVVYAGAYHIEIYKRFFEKLKFLKMLEVKFTGIRCLYNKYFSKYLKFL